jgi:hypothetical protein
VADQHLLVRDLLNLSMHLSVAADLAKRTRHVVLHDRLQGERFDIEREIEQLRALQPTPDPAQV